MRSRRRNAPSVPASLQRSASASNRRFSLPENWRRLAIATTSGSGSGASSEAASPVALALQLLYCLTSESIDHHDSEDHGWREHRLKRRLSFGHIRFGM